ncbi:hypothetical protein [Nitrososphaera viennensis]|nr:hypothetical protein [Nitrososphaera viennensis]UVS68979.1 hypothetical protein NWT39_13870 [Nitrososphaera viennensis]
MGTVALHLGNGRGEEEGLPSVIVKCPVCAGSGSIQCIKNNRVNPFCLSLPLATEERCNCCDGRGWVRKEQQECSSFCRCAKEEGVSAK